jgi:hypothetical protein
MTALALRVIRQNPEATYREFHTSLRTFLPSEDYPQSPQLEGSDANKDRKLFEPLAAQPEPEPMPSPTPEPAPAPAEPSGCLAGLMQQVARFFKG